MGSARVSLNSRKDVEAVGSSLRMEIIRHLQTHGPSTVFELARRMGRSADSLYYHVRRLQEVGVLARTGTRSGGRREEGVFGLAGEPLTVTVESAGDGAAEAVLESARAVLRDAEQNLAAVLERERLLQAGRPPVRAEPRRFADGAPRSLPMVVRMRGRLPEQAVNEVCAHLDAIAEIFVRHKQDEANGAEASPLHELAAIFAPLDDAGPRG
ncbi:MAG TPA: helix-turn-helix domain-containing protein [Planctomycetota bacterium]|nr:helix-turn-helix domain-containing protein [Planctomycetota bacterium]